MSNDVIEMVRQAGLAIGVALDGSKSVGKHEDKSFAVGRLPLEDFVAFSKLVAAKEREACAKVAEQHPAYDWSPAVCEITYAIRARGEA